MRKNKIKISHRTIKLLNIGLSAPLIALVYTIISHNLLSTYDAARQYGLLTAQMEHILMSILLLVVGAGIFDMAQKKNQV